MDFNWKNFNSKSNKIAVVCRTEKEVEDFIKQFNSSLKGSTASLEFYKNTLRESEQGNILFTFQSITKSLMEFTINYEFYEDQNYTIFPWKEYMLNSKHPANYLEENGLIIVENGRGDRGLISTILDGKIVIYWNEGFTFKASYNDQLEHYHCEDNSCEHIKTIYRLNCANIKTIYEFCYEKKHEDFGEIIWKRPKPIQIFTKSQIADLINIPKDEFKIEIEED